MRVLTETFSIENNNGEPVNFDLRYPETKMPMPLVFVYHGFKGFRNWGFYPWLCEQLAESGFFVVNPDFSLNGIIDSEKEIFDEEKFSRQTVSSELDDARILMNYFLKKGSFSSNFNKYFNDEIILIGHSLGAAVSILIAGEIRQIKKIILLGAISTLHRNTPRQITAWREDGFASVHINSTGQKLKLDYNYLKDKEENFPEGSILEKASELNVPVLLVHGSNDLTTRPAESEKIFNVLKNKDSSKLFIIKGTGHTFGIRHPLAEAGEALISAKDVILTFIKTK